ncbi:MAG: alpha/beta fold hydrolase [Vitreimonas sp.]
MIEQDATLEIDGVRIPGRIAWPNGVVRAAVLLLPGSLFSDVDGDYPMWNARPHTLRDLAHQFAARGVVSMRQAKIGPGTGSETVDAEKAKAHQRFVNRVAVARAALEHLRGEAPGVPIFVAGHSEGAVVASLLGAEPDVRLDGAVSLSGPALRLFDVMRGQTFDMMGGASDMAAFDRAVASLRANATLPEEAKSNPTLAGIANMPAAALEFIAQIDAVDPCAEIAKVKHRMLLVQGGRDLSVTPEQVDQLAAARAGLPTEIARFPELQHMYKRAPAGLDQMQSFMLSDESDPAVVEAIVTWMV